MADGVPLRLVLLAPDALVRAGVAALLASEDDVELVDDGSDNVDVVLLDASAELDGEAIGGDDGDDGAPVLALCEDIEQARLALHDGARAVLSRAARAPELVAAARAVARGLTVIDPSFCEALLDVPSLSPAHARDDEDADDAAAAERGAAALLVERLTPREHEVLSLLAEGLSNPDIAEALDISAHTAKFHVNAILDKLDARTRTEAVVRAARLGLLVL